MKAIYASKLYKSSPRKAKIVAAIKDPINAELVRQLREYLDDDILDNAVDSKGDPLKLNDKHDDGAIIDDKHESPEPPVDNTPDNHTDVDDEVDDNADNHITGDGVASAAFVYSSPIVADTSVSHVCDNPLSENQPALLGLSGELKGTLNARSNTSGVTRVAIKNNEVWIHYNDNTNLNNVMSDVIDTLNAANYSYLVFNRLARTDNAIVFTISSNDTFNSVNMSGGNNE